MEANEVTRGSSHGWIWEMDLFTLLNLGFDVGCVGVCIHILTSSYLVRRRNQHQHRHHYHPPPPPLRPKKSSSLNNQTSPTSTTTTTATRIRGNSVNGNGTNVSPPGNGTQTASPIPTSFSIWANKRFWIVTTSTIAALLWHLNRLLLIVALSWDTIHHGDSGGGGEAKKQGEEWDEEEGEAQGKVSNPFLRPPAMYIVFFLPVVLVLSRALLLASFGFPKRAKSSSSSSSSSSSPNDRDEKQQQQRHASTTTTTNTNTTNTSTPSLFSVVLDTVTSRMYGSNQNGYMLAFYVCMLGLVTFVPFTYSPVWYFDTPRVEFVTSLYLAGVLKDAERVKKGLSAKEKRQRGLSSFEHLVRLRWFVTLLTILGVGPEFGARFVFDGSVLFALYKLESSAAAAAVVA
ncbi:hypothetical protein FRC20_003633 [Serendipita sp. 405]|nr:hypothetical protein FRC20_003633 [Serendipita sp. 405]